MRLANSLGSVTLVGEPDGSRRHFGVPAGGAFDLDSYRKAIKIAEVPSGTPAYELAAAWAKFEHTGWVVIAGASCEIEVDGRRHVGNCRVFVNEVLEVHRPTDALRVYVIPSEASEYVRFSAVEATEALLGIHGPQASLFPALDSLVLQVSNRMDRKGIVFERLPEFEHSIELPSEPCIEGAIQITPNGTPILIGPDGPTIGGYPKPFVLDRTSLSRASQLLPNESVRISIR